MGNPTNSLHKFPYRPDDWRVWWDIPTQMWKAQRWTGAGGTISSYQLESNNLRCVGDGKFLRFTNCECKAGLIAFRGEQNVVVDCLRLLPRTQAVEVPVVELFGDVVSPT